MKTLLITLLFSLTARSESIDFTNKILICNYDLTVILENDIVLFTVVPLLGKLQYTITKDSGHKLMGVDFTEDLIKINQDNWYNVKFISDMDKYKCREVK